MALLPACLLACRLGEESQRRSRRRFDTFADVPTETPSSRTPHAPARRLADDRVR